MLNNPEGVYIYIANGAYKANQQTSLGSNILYRFIGDDYPLVNSQFDPENDQ